MYPAPTKKSRPSYTLFVHHALPILAEFEISDLFKPVIALIVVVIVLIVAVQALRRWMSTSDADEAPAAGFSLSALRQLVKDGKMTPEEFERAKAQIVQATQRAAERRLPPAPLPPELKVPPDSRG